LIFAHNVISFHDPWDFPALSGVFFPGQAKRAHPIVQLVLFETTMPIFNPPPKTNAAEGFPRSTVKIESDIFTRNQMKKQLLTSTDEGCFLF
jgi:hypothetical protein